MRTVIAFACALAACTPTPERSDEEPLAAEIDPTVPADAPPVTGSATVTVPGTWSMLSSGEGVGLRFEPASGAAPVHLFCASGDRELLVNLPAMTPVGSEERLTIGGGGDVVALVADPEGDPLRGGVSGRGDVPDGLARMLEAGFAASYGARSVGPLPAVGSEDAGRFAAACLRKE